MTTSNPTPSQILKALRDAGIKNLKTYNGWDTVGRPWKGPDGSPGLTGMVIHHTASPERLFATNSTPTLWWAVNAYDKPVCNLLIGRDEAYLLSAGSAYHCGKGGPIPELGIWSHGFQGQSRLFGIEIDDPGVKVGSMSDYQVETTAKAIAALSALCGFDIDEGVLTHKCYTDGCHTKAKSPLPSVGRKNDTIDGAWREFPGDPDPKPYNAPFWREKGKAALAPEPMWDGTVPQYRSVRKAQNDRELASTAAWRLACRLFDLGFGEKPKRRRVQTYPGAAVSEFRAAQGWRAGEGYSRRLEKRLFYKNK